MSSTVREALLDPSDGDGIRAVVVPAALLTAALVFFVPLFATVVGALGLPLPRPALVGVALVGAGYLAYVWAVGSLIHGSVAALVVTGTFAANVPLTANAGDYPGTLGPNVWLVQVPLVTTAALLLWRDRSFGPLSKVELGLGALVTWSFVPVVLGQAADSAVAVSYTVFWLVNVLLVYLVVKTVVYRGLADLRALTTALGIAAGGHATWAMIQVLNGNSLQFFTLGEGRRVWATPEASFGPLGSRSVGAFVSGFTGGSLAFVGLMALVAPILLALAIGGEGRTRWFAVLSFPVVTAAARATDKLSGIGGFALGVVVFAGLLVVLATRYDAVPPLGRRLENVATVLVSVPLILYPSARPPDLNGPASDGGSGGSGGTGGSGGGASGGGSPDAGILDPATFLDSLPFSLAPDSTFGIRIQQYVASLDLTRRFPVFGIGGGNFQQYSLDYGIPIPPGHDGPLSLHNLYLAMLAETGIPGLIAFAVAVVGVIYHGVRSLLEGVGDRILVAGCFAGLVGFLGLAFWDVVHLQITLLVPFWTVAAALVGQRLRTRSVEGA